MKSVDAIVRRVTLRELRLLAAIAHSGSILKAAQEVGLSQPALSKALADLEETLGVRLFDRTNRGVEPTPHGSVFIRRALAVFDEMRRGVEELKVLTDSTGGEIRMGARPRCAADFCRMRSPAWEASDRASATSCLNWSPRGWPWRSGTV